MNIQLDNLTGKEIASLLQEHNDDMLSHSPVESVHTLDLTQLQAPEITFWSGWIDDDLTGCGAIKEINSSHGEIKSMRTARSYLRQGVAGKMLTHILEEAKHRGYSRVSLETGSMDAFIPARKMYKRFGFAVCEPFEGYVDDPYSVFMTKCL